jgi:hypothetical protein
MVYVVEIFNKTMKLSLKLWCDENQKNWDELLAAAIFAYNTAYHSLLKETPYFLNHGCSPPTVSDNITNTDYYNGGDVHAYAQQLTKQLSDTHHRVREILEQVNEDRETKIAHELLPSFVIGEQVLLFDPTTRDGVSAKLVRRWTGPYTVIEKHSDVVYTIMKGEKQQKVNMSRLRKYKEDNQEKCENQTQLAKRELQAINEQIQSLNERKSVVESQHNIIAAEEILAQDEITNQIELGSVVISMLVW